MTSACRSRACPTRARGRSKRDLGEGALLLFHLAEDGRSVAAGGVGPIGKIAKEVRVAENSLIARARRPTPRLWLRRG